MRSTGTLLLVLGLTAFQMEPTPDRNEWSPLHCIAKSIANYCTRLAHVNIFYPHTLLMTKSSPIFDSRPGNLIESSQNDQSSMCPDVPWSKLTCLFQSLCLGVVSVCPSSHLELGGSEESMHRNWHNCDILNHTTSTYNRITRAFAQKKKKAR